VPPVSSKGSATEERRASKAIHVTGIVQGVGFRPFVYGLATRYGLKGWVCNSSGGVDIEVDGPEEAVRAFLASLREEAPSLAHIDRIAVAELSGNAFETFEIRESVTRAGRFQPISPDVATCQDCLREVFDPADRRFRYPFTNCTNCGPRFTIIEEIPYDRPNTTMRTFRMCPVCAGEYRDPANRRFHAQPNACPRCGPKLWLEGEG
jgi:hydrogenase maturation protein HypF